MPVRHPGSRCASTVHDLADVLPRRWDKSLPQFRESEISTRLSQHWCYFLITEALHVHQMFSEMPNIQSSAGSQQHARRVQEQQRCVCPVWAQQQTCRTLRALSPSSTWQQLSTGYMNLLCWNHGLGHLKAMGDNFVPLRSQPLVHVLSGRCFFQ